MNEKVAMVTIWEGNGGHLGMGAELGKNEQEIENAR